MGLWELLSCSGQEGGALLNRISALMDETPGSSLTLPPYRTEQEGVRYASEDSPHQTVTVPEP